MAFNSQSRKWTLTLNNPKDAGFTREKIKSILERFMPRYYCIADEVSTTGTKHTHIFILADSPIRFSTLKDRFPIAHIEKAFGSAKDNRDYIRKEGKWAQTEKAETVVAGSFEEQGYLPSEKEESSPQLAQLIQEIYNQESISNIVINNPAFALRIKDITILQQALLTEKYNQEKRDVDVSYLFGATGTGKTHGIYEKYPAKDICRITNYRGSSGVNFDSYNFHNVLVFEEFASQIPIENMLCYLDVYPLMLPARYSDKVACYTKVIITSNIPLDQQYLTVQHKHPETWRAFLRRIHHVVEYLPDGSTRELTTPGGVYNVK